MPFVRWLRPSVYNPWFVLQGLPMLKALCQSLCLILPLAASAQPASVVFLNPGLSTETFWTSYTRFMQAAADELGMTLRVEYSERRADQALSHARAILTGRSGRTTWYWSTSSM